MISSNKPNVTLILDDASFVVEFSNMSKEHFEIYCFENAFQFIQWTNKNQPVKLIVCGFNLLGVNGITLRKNCKNIPKTANVPFFLIVDRINDSKNMWHCTNILPIFLIYQSIKKNFY
jgi:response regulator RpfG family c-di-GMP phosphodiesterase